MRSGLDRRARRAHGLNAGHLRGDDRFAHARIVGAQAVEVVLGRVVRAESAVVAVRRAEHADHVREVLMIRAAADRIEQRLVALVAHAEHPCRRVPGTTSADLLHEGVEPGRRADDEGIAGGQLIGVDVLKDVSCAGRRRSRRCSAAEPKRPSSWPSHEANSIVRLGFQPCCASA